MRLPPWFGSFWPIYPSSRRVYRLALALEQLETRNLPSFVAPLNYYENKEPTAVAGGDFNNDGVPDLVTSSFGTPQRDVSVLLGNGDGSFETPRDSTSSGYSTSVAVADLNGDGNLDVITANDDGTVDVLLGYGDGTFHTARAYAAGEQPDFVALGDFNGDGNLDIVAANYGDDTVSVLLGYDDGTFQRARTYAAGPQPQSLAIADFNGDGIPDLVVANGTHFPLNPPQLTLLVGNGDGSFQAPVTFNTDTQPGITQSVAAADFNGDGIPDLATTNGRPYVRVLLGNGNGTFQAPRDYGDTSGLLTVADVNNDGIADLALLDNGVNILRGNGDGSFQTSSVTYSVGEFPTGLALGDFNGDGLPDFAVANQGSGDISVRLGNGDGSFAAVPSFRVGSSPTALAVGDVNGDGLPDVVTANSGNNTVSVLLGNGDGSFGTQIAFAAGGPATFVTLADVNGDGHPDLVVTGPGAMGSATTVSVLLGNGDGTFQSPSFSDAGQGPFRVAVGDFNGDGSIDLVVADAGTRFGGNSAVSVLLGNGDGSFQSPSVYGTDWLPSAFAVGDFNDDGRTDVVVASGTGMHLLLGNGDGSFQVQNTSFNLAASDLVVGDFNGDGQLDIATPTVTVLLGNGNGTFQATQYYFAGIRGLTVTTGDFNEDGRLDLAVASGGGVRVLVGNGDGSFQSSINSYGAGSGPDSIGAADFTGDGFPDLVTANRDSNDVTLLINAADWPAPPRSGSRPGAGLGGTAGALGSALEASGMPAPAAETAVVRNARSTPTEMGTEPFVVSGIAPTRDQTSHTLHPKPVGFAGGDWQAGEDWVLNGQCRDISSGPCSPG